jgi:hypothetical protein
MLEQARLRSKTPQLSGRSSPGWVLSGAAALQIVFLCLAAWQYRHALNPDGIAYIRLAGYYSNGQSDLAISGYWGPLLSWLMVPWLKLGLTPIAAARIAMGLTAVVFLWGCHAVFRSLQLPERLLQLGFWLAAGLSIYWSVENITPDLLVAGLVGFAFSHTVTTRWLEKPRQAALAGLMWGLAYWAKAVALPLALVVSVGIGALWSWKSPGRLKQIARSFCLTLLVFSVASGAWIAVLTQKYGQLTISTSARLNHAMVGPSAKERLYPFGWNFQAPEPGRVTVWEDPSRLPYPDWSPWTSLANAQHQMRVMADNVPTVLFMLTSIYLLFPWFLAAATVRLLRTEWSQALAGQYWWWAVLPVAGLGLIYMPGNLLVTEQRYFYSTFPFLFGLGAGAWFMWRPNPSRELPGRFGWLALIAAFVLPALARPWLRPGSTRVTGECAYVLAAKLAAANLRGPLAGNGFVAGGRAGLCAAFYLDQPWHGDEPQPTAERYLASQAKLIIVNRHRPIAGELGSNSHFQNLDSQLFAGPEAAAGFPLKVFMVRSP